MPYDPIGIAVRPFAQRSYRFFSRHANVLETLSQFVGLRSGQCFDPLRHLFAYAQADPCNTPPSLDPRIHEVDVRARVDLALRDVHDFRLEVVDALQLPLLNAKLSA